MAPQVDIRGGAAAAYGRPSSDPLSIAAKQYLTHLAGEGARCKRDNLCAAVDADVKRQMHVERIAAATQAIGATGNTNNSFSKPVLATSAPGISIVPSSGQTPAADITALRAQLLQKAVAAGHLPARMCMPEVGVTTTESLANGTSSSSTAPVDNGNGAPTYGASVLPNLADPHGDGPSGAAIAVGASLGMPAGVAEGAIRLLEIRQKEQTDLLERRRCLERQALDLDKAFGRLGRDKATWQPQFGSNGGIAIVPADAPTDAADEARTAASDGPVKLEQLRREGEELRELAAAARQGVRGGNRLDMDYAYLGDAERARINQASGQHGQSSFQGPGDVHLSADPAANYAESINYAPNYARVQATQPGAAPWFAGTAPWPASSQNAAAAAAGGMQQSYAPHGQPQFPPPFASNGTPGAGNVFQPTPPPRLGPGQPSPGSRRPSHSSLQLPSHTSGAVTADSGAAACAEEDASVRPTSGRPNSERPASGAGVSSGGGAGNSGGEATPTVEQSPAPTPAAPSPPAPAAKKKKKGFFW